MKNLLQILLFLTISSTSISQEFEYNHSGGLTYIIGKLDGAHVGYYERGYVGLTYNPRYDYVLGDNMSLGLSAYPTICFDFSSESSSNSGTSSSLMYCFESPLVLQFNLGNDATSNSDSKVGFFIGGGINFGIYSELQGNGIIDEFNSEGVITGKYTSLCLQAGAKINSLGARVELNKPLGIKEGYTVKILGIGVFYNF